MLFFITYKVVLFVNFYFIFEKVLRNKNVRYSTWHCLKICRLIKARVCLCANNLEWDITHNVIYTTTINYVIDYTYYVIHFLTEIQNYTIIQILFYIRFKKIIIKYVITSDVGSLYVKQLVSLNFCNNRKINWYKFIVFVNFRYYKSQTHKKNSQIILF